MQDHQTPVLTSAYSPKASQRLSYDQGRSGVQLHAPELWLGTIIELVKKGTMVVYWPVIYYKCRDFGVILKHGYEIVLSSRVKYQHYLKFHVLRANCRDTL